MRKDGVIHLKRNITTLLYLKAFSRLWLRKSHYFLSPVSRWHGPKQKQDGLHIKELSNASEVGPLLLCFAKTACWVPVCFVYKPA